MILMDHLQNGYLSDDLNGPEIGDIITFLCGRPYLGRKTKTLPMFLLSCLFVFPCPLPVVQFGSAVSCSEGPNLAKNIEPVQS